MSGRDMIEAAWAAIKTDTRSGARYHRLVRRFGGYRNPVAKQKAITAITAIAHTLIVTTWQMLTSNTTYTDLGADFYTRRHHPKAQTRRLVATPEALGNTVTTEPAAA